ncbi:hypothetical protein THAPSDRAFT_268247 [Thalassiosira pseudonana CCMP1335]|uniref:Histone RNA hairpin-binding protein RNA-binding domain-containing protein n=1 Tax=Thalassiosira pseudonana TaxID=35128 RepID=B8BU79_THAPS|nr:hypothetical protein THAPSDRAFT_268247 [Thalassiosira pseudonana CCMP1335]EED95237.1 hypothetical protein THAPSDRAFT_268247 [Thalassiosira pseudonana CCMP1335]
MRFKENEGNHQNSDCKSSRPAKIISPDDTDDNNKSASPSTSHATSSTDLPKLDPSKPDHARRIHQRRRQVLFGKNTAGYECYTKQVPRHKRRLRCADHPMTPDHLVDVSARRWQGMMNAWRRSLHKFDPPDLTTRQLATANKSITLAPRPTDNEEDRVAEEIAQAKASGLQVAFGALAVEKGGFGGLFSVGVATDEDCGERVGNGEETKSAELDEEAAYQQTMLGLEEEGPNDGGFLEEECDSDEDIL